MFVKESQYNYLEVCASVFWKSFDLLEWAVIALGDLAQDPDIITTPELDTGVVNDSCDSLYDSCDSLYDNYDSLYDSCDSLCDSLYKSLVTAYLDTGVVNVNSAEPSPSIHTATDHIVPHDVRHGLLPEVSCSKNFFQLLEQNSLQFLDINITR